MDGAKEKTVDSAVLTLKELGDMLLHYAENASVMKVITDAIDRRLRSS